MIKALYDNSTSVVLINTQVVLLKSTFGVRQGCLLSPLQFNVFIEEIEAEIKYNYSLSISIGGISLWNLKFADVINLLASTHDDLQELANSATRYGMEIIAEKSMVIVNSNDDSIHENTTLNGNKLEKVNTLYYLDATLSKDRSCKTEIKIRLSIATSAILCQE